MMPNWTEQLDMQCSIYLSSVDISIDEIKALKLDFLQLLCNKETVTAKIAIEFTDVRKEIIIQVR